jgi:hypothetical protein
MSNPYLDLFLNINGELKRNPNAWPKDETMKAQSTYTKGPWAVDKNFPTDVLGFDRAVLIQSEDIPDDEESRANAHLIAAAPELLQAIERLLNTPALAKPENLNNHDASALNEAYQAIKKARGSL